MLRLELADAYDLGGEFFRWETATAVAGFLLGVHPFDQPDVEAAKAQAGRALAAYRERGSLPEEPATRAGEGMAFFGDAQGPELRSALRSFLGAARPGDYLGIHAYLPPRPPLVGGLETLRRLCRGRTRRAVTLGFGPRFLHSTGQLHKGGPPTGRFL